jgi:hypothetical protein
MEYRQLGATDMQVSVICLGTMTFGEQNSFEEAAAQLDYAVGEGVNFIDAAEMYPVPPRAATQGDTERFIGRWLHSSGKRPEVLLATKVSGRNPPNGDFGHLRGGPRLTREQIHSAIDDSLERLQTDHVDLYQVHWPERVTNFFGQLGYRHHETDAVAIEETPRGPRRSGEERQGAGDRDLQRNALGRHGIPAAGAGAGLSPRGVDPEPVQPAQSQLRGGPGGNGDPRARRPSRLFALLPSVCSAANTLAARAPRARA